MSVGRRAVLAGLAPGLPRFASALTMGDSVSTVGESLDQIRAKGRLKIAVYEDFAPFSALRDGELMVGSPITWEQDGEQYVAVVSGWGGDVAKIVHSFNQGGSVWAFKLVD